MQTDIRHISLLSPILSPILVTYTCYARLKKKVIKSMDIEFPFYYRYVYDIVVLASVDRDNILNSFNKIHNRF